MTKIFGSKMTHFASFLGSKKVSASEVATLTGSPAEFRVQKLGIETIAVALPYETPAVLAQKAIDKLFAQKTSAASTTSTMITKSEVEFLILVTQNPDYKLPTTACLVQSLAQLPQKILAYDVNQGCSGFPIALAQAHSFIASGMFKQGLVVTSDTYNKFINPSDRNTYGLFGDGASAVLVERCPQGEGVGPFFFGTDGQFFDRLILKSGGSAFPEKLGDKGDYIAMDGKAVFRFVIDRVPGEITRFLQEQNLKVEDIDYWVLHQANKYMNKSLTDKLGIPSDKAFFDIHEFGNTVSASIPIAWEKALPTMKQRGVKKVFLCGFGVGLSWSGCLYNL
jgi:3-oxoacyl-[acyl-carrier-protein] synthase-3